MIRTLKELEYDTRHIAEDAIQKNAKQQGLTVSHNKLHYDKKESFEDVPSDVQ